MYVYQMYPFRLLHRQNTEYVPEIIDEVRGASSCFIITIPFQQHIIGLLPEVHH